MDVSTVAFRELDEPLLTAYLASGEWRGRAGSYAIQGLGSALVDIVRGDVSNVIGLPVGLLLRLAPQLVADCSSARPEHSAASVAPNRRTFGLNFAGRRNLRTSGIFR